ncbi:MAG: gamma-glutamyltransferase [Bryobacteraceae bacterium]
MLKVRTVLALLTLAFTAAAQQQRVFERVELFPETTLRTMRPVMRGRSHAVTSMEAPATQAAEQVLRAGGNAFDAIVAGQAVLGLVAPASNGIGGDAMLLVYDARARQVYSVNAEGTAPKLATIEWYKKNKDGKLVVNDSLLAGTVPGVIDAWYTLLSRWGTKGFAEVLAPAIDLAENGFPVSEGLARSLSGGRDLKKYPSTARLYLKEARTWKAGEVWRNPDLARTFKRLIEAEHQAAAQGRAAALKAARDRFYKGDIAREMAEFSEKNGGLFRYEDFATYAAKVETPVATDYRGYRVFKNPSASQAPAELFALNLLEGYDLKAMGHNSATYIHASVEAIKLAMADRDKYLGDLDFIKVPYEGLLSKKYAEERRKLINPDRASTELRPGNPEAFMTGFEPVERPLDVSYDTDADHHGDTSYIAVVDKDRNAISFTPSLHSGFGTKVVMAELGFSFNCRGDYFSLIPGNANALEGGKRPRSTLQGTIVTKDERLFLVTGSPGGDDQCMRTMQTLLNIVDFGMNVQQAIEAPRWSTKGFPASPFPHTMHPGDLEVEGRVNQATRASLIRKGHKVSVVGPWTLNLTGAILSDAATGVLHTGADPRSPGYALAW